MRVKKISQRSIGLLRRMPSAKQANLEKKRGLFFQIGLIVSLSIVLLAFEWTTVRTNIIDRNYLGRGEIIEELAEVSFHKKKLPKIPIPKIINPIAVPDETEIEEDYIIDAEITDETINNPDQIFDFWEKDIVEEDPVLLYNVEKWPEFPGGEQALFAFFSDNLKYTSSAREINLEGIVYVNFVVWKDGSIRDVKILRGLGAGLDEEVIRVVGLMPKWKPGFQNGRNVSVIYNLPVKFKLN